MASTSTAYHLSLVHANPFGHHGNRCVVGCVPLLYGSTERSRVTGNSEFGDIALCRC